MRHDKPIVCLQKVGTPPKHFIYALKHADSKHTIPQYVVGTKKKTKMEYVQSEASSTLLQQRTVQEVLPTTAIAICNKCL